MVHFKQILFHPNEMIVLLFKGKGKGFILKKDNQFHEMN